MALVTSKILINKVSYSGVQVSASSYSFNHQVTSPDEVLVVTVLNAAGLGTEVPSVTFNGVPMNSIITGNDGGISQSGGTFILTNPPVGIYSITVSTGGTPNSQAVALSILGIAKVNQNFYSTSNTSSNLPFTPPQPGSFILDALISNGGVVNSVEYTQILNTSGGGVAYGIASQASSRTIWSNNGFHFLVALPPKNATSLSYPAISDRNIDDVTRVKNLNAPYGGNANTFGSYSPNYWKNSFLHTVGRINQGFTFLHGTSTKGSFVKQNRIIVDNILKWGISSVAAGNPINFTVPSQDSVLLVFIGVNNTTDSDNCFYNGVQLTRLGKVGSGSNQVNVYYTNNPAVGNNTLTFTFASGSQVTSVVAVSLLGVNKKIQNPIVSTNTTGNGLIQAPSANSLIIDAVSNSTATPSAEQGGIIREGGAGLLAVSFRYSSGSVNMNWTGGSLVQTIVALEPANAASLFSPNISFRDALDSSATNNFNYSNANPNASVYAKPHPLNFSQNSFLHTVGRILPPKPPTPTVVNETERPTSQIIIDKVFQGQIAAVALSTVTLSLQVSISSPDAVLVVTGGSVITTGNPWANVQFNGNNLTKIVQTSVAGADAEIWYMPNPPVGTYTLLITSGTGGEIYANAMVLLGVDKKNTNLIAASTTDAASTSSITTQLQNDSQGAFIIDTVSASDTAQPIPDQLQTQVFNATALAGIENVLSTYKIAQPGQVTMSYNLTTAVNAAMVAVAFRQAKPASIWNPNIDLRSIDDVVTTSGLDAERNPSFGNYGYKPSVFYKNSFLHTIGKLPPPQTFVTGLLNNLASYYSFDENTGSIIHDKSGNRNHLTIRGDVSNVWETDGKINSSGKFNGASNVAVLPSASNNAPFNTSSISFGGWFWIDAQQRSGFPHLINLGAGDQAAIYFNTATGVLNYKFSSINGNLVDTTFVPANSVLFNQWVHLLVVFTGQQTIGYLNGVKTLSFNAGGNINFTSNAIFIGAQDGAPSSPFFGKAGEVGIWNRSLSSYEVKNLYNLGHGLPYPFLPNKNTVSVGFQGYNYYAEGKNSYAGQNWQTSFLQTIGRLNFLPNLDQVGLKTGLISYYKLDEKSGNNVKDEMNNAPGVWVNTSPRWGNGVVNGGAFFTGGTDAILIPSPGNTKYNNLFKFSLSCWVYLTDIQQQLARVFNCDAGPQGFGIWINASNSVALDVGNTTTNTQTGASGLAIKQWYHIVGTYDGFNLRIYVNAVQKGAGTLLAGSKGTGTAGTVSIGGNLATRGYSGYVDECGFWNRALSRDEILQLYNNGYGLQYPFLEPKTNLGPYYSATDLSYYQNSLLYTIGRIPILQATATQTVNAPSIMMMGVGM